MRWGEQIAIRDGSDIRWSPFAHRYIECDALRRYEIPDETTLDVYLRGGVLTCPDLSDGLILLAYDGIDIVLDRIKDGKIVNLFPRDWRRR